jgi:hypothetical protein
LGSSIPAEFAVTTDPGAAIGVVDLFINFEETSQALPTPRTTTISTPIIRGNMLFLFEEPAGLCD